MTGTPFDGLGSDIKKGFKRRLKLLLWGYFICEFCGEKKSKAELVKDYLGRWECTSCAKEKRG